MASNAAVTSSDKQKEDDPMKQTMLIIEHKIRNLEKRKIKLEGYLQQRNGPQLLTGEQLSAASKYNEVISNLDFAKNLKKQLTSLVTTTRQKKKHLDDKENLPINVYSKIKEVLIFQNILECIKNETVQHDLLTGYGGVVLTDCEISSLSHFSKMVLPKRKIEDRKPLKSFEDTFKTVAKHYSKLIDGTSNIVAGTSYAHLKECLLKIEKSGYLDYMTKNKQEAIINEVNNSESTILDIAHQPIDYLNDCTSNNIPMSSIPKVEGNENKIETIYFTNNSVDKGTTENENITVFNTSFDFLQDSQLEEDHINVNFNTVPTKTFSSMYIAPTDDILKVQPTSSQNRTMAFDKYKEENLNRLSRENWTMAQTGVGTNSDWNQSVGVEVNKQPTHETNSNFGLVTNGYTEDLNELLQKSLIFNKQNSYPVINNNSTLYQNNFGKELSKNSTEYYANSNINYDRSQSNKFNKKSNTGEAGGGTFHGYQQGNSYNKNDYYRISRQT